MSDYQYPSTLAVTTTGGWARPGWWDILADAEKEGRFGPADRRELLDDYCQLAIYDQEAAGLDALTDGEHRRGGWIEGITGRMAGLALKPTPRKLGAIGWDQLPVYEVLEPLDQALELGERLLEIRGFAVSRQIDLLQGWSAGQSRARHVIQRRRRGSTRNPFGNRG